MNQLHSVIQTDPTSDSYYHMEKNDEQNKRLTLDIFDTFNFIKQKLLHSLLHFSRLLRIDSYLSIFDEKTKNQAEYYEREGVMFGSLQRGFFEGFATFNRRTVSLLEINEMNKIWEILLIIGCGIIQYCFVRKILNKNGNFNKIPYY